jgi:heptosyltransferase III
MKRGKILVVRGGAIGDFILTLPVLAALREQFPDAHREVLGYPHIAQLALIGGLVDRVRSIEARALAGFFAPGNELDPGLVDYFGSFGLIISYLYDPDEYFRANIARCSRAQFIAGPHRPDENVKLHATEVFLKPLERLAIFNADPVPRLSVLSKKLGDREGERLGEPISSGNSTVRQEPRPPDGMQRVPIVALHPGSGSERKNWPEAKWAQLLTYLITSTHCKILLVGGEAEGDRLKRLSATLPPERHSILQSAPLTELAQRLSACAGFVGHDSGISHLAAAVGLPAVVLWGDTDETIWRPQGAQVILVREPRGLGELTVEQVVEELRRIVPVK